MRVEVAVELVQGGMAALHLDFALPASRRTRRCTRAATTVPSAAPSATRATTAQGVVGAHVIAISSTADDEESWENDDGGPLTAAFAAIVARAPDLPLCELMGQLQCVPPPPPLSRPSLMCFCVCLFLGSGWRRAGTSGWRRWRCGRRRWRRICSAGWMACRARGRWRCGVERWMIWCSARGGCSGRKYVHSFWAERGADWWFVTVVEFAAFGEQYFVVV